MAVKNLAFAAAIIIESFDALLTGGFAILENFGWHSHRRLLLIRPFVTSGPERSPIGRGEAMRGWSLGREPNVSRSGQRRRLSFDAPGIWSKLLITAYE